QDDAADPVGIALDAQVRLGHRSPSVPVGEDVDDRHARTAATGVVLQRVAVAGVDLAIAGFGPQLPPALGDLGDAGRADRVAFRAQPAGGVDRDPTRERRFALERRASAVALLEEPEVFDVEDLGDGEAVVHLGAVDVGRTDAGHRVRALRREARRLDLGERLL